MATLFDLATVVTPQQLEHAFNEAEVQRLASPTPLRARDRLPHLPRRPRPPRPVTNGQSDHGELDATWPAARLVVEVDGFAAHGTRRAFEAVLRLTSRQLTRDADTIARRIRILLAGTV